MRRATWRLAWILSSTSVVLACGKSRQNGESPGPEAAEATTSAIASGGSGGDASTDADAGVVIPLCDGSDAGLGVPVQRLSKQETGKSAPENLPNPSHQRHRERDCRTAAGSTSPGTDWHGTARIAARAAPGEASSHLLEGSAHRMVTAVAYRYATIAHGHRIERNPIPSLAAPPSCSRPSAAAMPATVARRVEAAPTALPRPRVARRVAAATRRAPKVASAWAVVLPRKAAPFPEAEAPPAAAARAAAARRVA